MAQEEKKPEGIHFQSTFGKTFITQETYANGDGDFTSTSLRAGTGLGDIVDAEGKTIIGAKGTGILDCKSGKGDTCVEKARLDVTAPIGSIGTDYKLGAAIQNRTTVNLEDLGKIGDGALSTSARLAITASTNVGDKNISIYGIPNATKTTGQDEIGLAATLGAQIKTAKGTAVYGETYKKVGGTDGLKNIPMTYGLGLSMPF